MSKILRTLLILLVIFALATWFFTVFKACSDKNKVAETVENTADVVGEKLTDAKEATEESLEDLFDDDDAPTGDDSANANSDASDDDASATDNASDEVSATNSGSNNSDDQSGSSSTDDKNALSARSTTSTATKSTSTAARENSGSWNYLVVTGNYLTEAYAKEEVQRLKSKGFNDAEMVTFDLSQYYTSIAGRYTSLTKARTMKNMAAEKGFEAYVHKKRSKK